MAPSVATEKSSAPSKASSVVSKKQTRIKIVRNSSSTSSSTSSSWIASPFVALAALVLAVVGGSRLHTIFQGWKASLHQMILRQAFQVSVHSDFLPEHSDLLQRAQNETLWRACHEITAKGVLRFWYDPQQPPKNVFEELAVAIYRETPYWDQAVSYEYWCNIIEPPSDPSVTSRMDHPWHTDRDEDVLERERRFVFPLMGAVYYGFDTPYTGGDFHMIASVPYKRDPDDAPQNKGDDCHFDLCVTQPDLFQTLDPQKALLVPTTFNTLLFANVSHFHRVTRVTSGRRFALAVNANHWKPYPEISVSWTHEEMLTAPERLQERAEARTFGL